MCCGPWSQSTGAELLTCLTHVTPYQELVFGAHIIPPQWLEITKEEFNKTGQMAVIKHRAQSDKSTADKSTAQLHFARNQPLLYPILSVLLFVSCPAQWVSLGTVPSTRSPTSRSLRFVSLPIAMPEFACSFLVACQSVWLMSFFLVFVSTMFVCYVCVSMCL